MNKTFAVAAATLVALTPAAAFAKNNQNSGTKTGSPADLIWSGSANASCSISADKEGTLTLSNNQQYLTSEGVQHAELGYTTAGPQGTTFTIKSTDSSVMLGNTEQLGDNQNETVDVRYNNSGQWQQVWQQNSATYLDNQAGATLTRNGSGTVDVDVRTTAHTNGGGSVAYGNYTVRTTVSCFVK